MEGVAGMFAPAGGSFQGAGFGPLLSFRWKTPPSVGRSRAVKSPSFTAHFLD